jgi:type I restriction enzyme, S subunit
LAGEWQEIALQDLAQEITVGFVGPMVSEYVPNGIPFLRSLNVEPYRINCVELMYISESFHQRIKKSALAPGDVVIVRTGKPGTAAVIPDTLPISNCSDLVIVRPGAQLDSRFLAYYINSVAQHHISAYTVGAVQQHFNVGSAKDLKLMLPPLDQQRAIARILGALDDKIESNRRMNRTLEAMAQALFKSWFVDFEPVIAKRDGRKPAGMDEATTALFPEHFQETQMGPIPAGWRVRRLPQAIEVNPRRVLQQGTLAPYLDMQNMPTSSAIPEDWSCREVASGMHFKNHDTLMARITPCLENGKTAYISFLDKDQIGWGSTEYIVLSPQEPLPPSYAYFLTRTDDFRSFAIANMTGSSGRQRVPVSCLDNYYIAVPDAPVATAFGCVAGKCLTDIQSKLVQNRSLAALRSAILPKLLSGELRVGQAEKIIEEV